eukprot:6196968-Pleurochrysis_carterae.AAC.8
MDRWRGIATSSVVSVHRRSSSLHSASMNLGTCELKVASTRESAPAPLESGLQPARALLAARRSTGAALVLQRVQGRAKGALA